MPAGLAALGQCGYPLLGGTLLGGMVWECCEYHKGLSRGVPLGLSTGRGSKHERRSQVQKLVRIADLPLPAAEVKCLQACLGRPHCVRRDKESGLEVRVF